MAAGAQDFLVILCIRITLYENKGSICGGRDPIKMTLCKTSAVTLKSPV